jgi:hypothetical protein
MPGTGDTMTRRPRRNHSPAFKAKVALAAIRGEQTLVCKFYELHVAKSSKVATETVERMAELWEIEDTVRGQSPEARVG